MTRRRGCRPGPKHHKAVLTTEQVRALRAMYRPYVCGYATCAKAFGISPNTARDILTYRTRISE